MAQKLVITLDEETTKNYLKLAKQRISAKLDADAACIFESSAQFGDTEIGKVQVDLIPSD